jgi:hypothetical protein
MTWDYRVIEFVEMDGTPWQAIHEVHYDDSGAPNGYGENPAVIQSSDAAGCLVSLEWVLDRMREALAKPVLVERDFQRSTPSAHPVQSTAT